MKTSFIILFILLSQISFAQNHDKHAMHTMKNNNQKAVSTQFKAPKDLSDRMEKIHTIIKGLNKNKNDNKVVLDSGAKITETVNDIFKTCKLESAADEAIHPSLGLILDGAEELKKGDYESGHRKINEAMLNYKKLFK